MIKYKKEQINNLNEDIKKHFSHVFPIESNMKNTHKGISRMVMLDRYTQKDLKLKTLRIGDLVVAKIKEDPQFPTLGIGNVVKIQGSNIVVEVEQGY
jgi:ribonucleoside-diphosphate reductase alpha chain